MDHRHGSPLLRYVGSSERLGDVSNILFTKAVHEFMAIGAPDWRGHVLDADFRRQDLLHASLGYAGQYVHPGSEPQRGDRAKESRAAPLAPDRRVVNRYMADNKVW